MIFDKLANGKNYFILHKYFEEAFTYLQNADLFSADCGRVELIPGKLIAIISEYDTRALPGEQMEAHKKFIDIQHVITGAERIGIALLENQVATTAYTEERDFHLFSDEPDFFLTLKEGEFAIFFPTDLHMPSLSIWEQGRVKKVVMKISVEE